MAEAVVTFVVNPLIQQALSIFASPLDSRIRQLWNSGDLKKELDKLKVSLGLIESVLKNADQMQSDEGTRVWLQSLQDAVDDLRDLRDEDAYGVNRHKGWIQSQFRKQVHNFLFPSKSMLSKMKEVNESFHRIVEQSNCIRLIKDNQNLQVPRLEEADESIHNSEVLQRDADVLKIERLLDESSQAHQLSGLSIVGMTGVGKTALAGSIRERARSNVLYNHVVWMSEPEDFKRGTILRHMLDCVDSHAGGMQSSYAMECHLEKLFPNKKILLILDGVLKEDAQRLQLFISYLPKRFKTTKISVVITTSNKEVASIMGTIGLHKHELQKLSDDDCWLIMEENVRSSSNGTPIEDPQLLDIGKDIAKQCGGLPLVAAVFGKHLGARIGVNEWSAIRDNKAWHAPHRLEILSHLKKSYDHLPPLLKGCFSFCSIFPKEKIVKISRDELVQCWMANGFLPHSNSDKEEDVGNNYFNDLVSNYLLEDVEMDECGNIKFCKMHDEVHNLSLLSAKYETCIWPDTPQVEDSVRHLRVKSNGNSQTVPEDVPQRLHSLFLDVDVLRLMPKKSRSLQSLKLAAADANGLQSSLGRLKYYMKYLDISESAIERLPKSVSKLYNLQTLRFTGCNSLEKLPSGIENLVSLRHIYFDESYVPSSIGKLASLQTLPLFVVGTEKGRTIEELKSLNQLRGKLKICKLELVSSQSEAREARLEDKGELIKLQFVWSENRANNPEDMGVLEGLQPPSTLKSLTIENYRGGNCPSWMMNLKQLVKLKLIDCDECGNISCLERLPELKVLNIQAMHNVSRIGRMSYHQSSSQGEGESILPVLALRKLTLRKMTKLEGCETTQGMVVFSCLEELHIGDCPELKTWCASNSQGRGDSIIPFPVLKKLTLSNMTKLEKWTEAEGMVVFPCLEELHIEHCPELKTWWASSSQGEGESILPFPALRKLTLRNRELQKLYMLFLEHSLSSPHHVIVVP
ncbi:hypothetical protein SLEP1_g45177 [Rubroshorea leprosula]|uniref:Uncharacterized protein n=1 Tax=Rubroshorea leprosula TaxID=152421 RepID=A0AAV5LJU2_9ROSI|nr:hypothetical protein SLEP1_g45177 [Rubroshorea leprosula]